MITATLYATGSKGSLVAFATSDDDIQKVLKSLADVQAAVQAKGFTPFKPGQPLSQAEDTAFMVRVIAALEKFLDTPAPAPEPEPSPPAGSLSGPETARGSLPENTRPTLPPAPEVDPDWEAFTRGIAFDDSPQPAASANLKVEQPINMIRQVPRDDGRMDYEFWRIGPEPARKYPEIRATWDEDQAFAKLSPLGFTRDDLKVEKNTRRTLSKPIGVYYQESPKLNQKRNPFKDIQAVYYLDEPPF